MGTSRQKAHVNRTILTWAREQSGLSVEAAARKIQVKPEKLQAWEGGSDKPTIRQLRVAARVYHFSFSIFFLSTPPEGYQAIRDYRRLPDAAERQLSPELVLEVRRAYDRRDVALELLGELGEEQVTFGLHGSITDNPEVLGARIRQELGVSAAVQASWRDPATGFKEFRIRLERAGILVFQAAGVDLEEMRGFSIGNGDLPIVVVNRGDAYAGRSFTLLHEVTHITLQAAGLCNLHEVAEAKSDTRRVEVFCNAVAGAALVPRQELEGMEAVRSHRGTHWSLAELEPLARRFAASRQVIIRRMLDMGRTDQPGYDRVMEALDREFRNLPKREGGFISPPENFLSLAGRTFAGLVVGAYRENKITASALADIIGLRLRHLDVIERAVAS